MSNYLKTEQSKFYSKEYGERQLLTQKVSGLADARKFQSILSTEDKKILDFGSGPGNIILNLNGSEKVAVEPNAIHHEILQKNNCRVFNNTHEACESLGQNYFDVVVSNHCLEHVLDPINEIRNLYFLLKPGGLLLLFVPFEGLNTKYISDDVNNHLYTWSPRNLGNLFMEASNWEIINVDKYLPKWPPFYEIFFKMGWTIFDVACSSYGYLVRSPSQVFILASKPS